MGDRIRLSDISEESIKKYAETIRTGATYTMVLPTDPYEQEVLVARINALVEHPELSDWFKMGG
jgi:hypothetical protein